MANETLEELRKKVQQLQKRKQELEGRKQAHEEEYEKVKKEIIEAGFKSPKELKAHIDETIARQEKLQGQLQELLNQYEAA